jgi:hypothetical protein
MELPSSRDPIVSTLPKPWEEEESFHDVLYDWMERAPWILLSGGLHFVLFLIVAAIPWSVFEPTEERRIVADIEAPLPEEPEEDPPEEPEEISPEETEDVPVLEDFTETEVVTDSNDVNDAVTDAVAISDNPFENDGENPVIGIGGGPFGGTGGPRGRGGPGGTTRSTERAVHDGLQWLADHQDSDGSWDSDEFMLHDPVDDRTGGPGDPNHDVGLTGLALLAFLGDGHSLTHGAHQGVVVQGARFLSRSQNKETGLIGDAIGHSFIYDHALATLSLCELYRINRSIIVKTRAQKAIDYLSRHRQPYGVWGYQPPPSGSSDTSVTGWALFAFKSAQDAGLKVDQEAFTATLLWLDEMTDPGTGRVGYTERGSPSSRVPGINDQFPTDRGEALTSVGLLSRFFLGQTPDEYPVMRAQADLLAQTPPRWDPESGACDMYYWYYGSYAMFQMGGHHWKNWNKAMKGAVVESQRPDGSAKGSWDPAGPWGPQGGRVYATATMVLSLEVYYRYARLTGAR